MEPGMFDDAEGVMRDQGLEVVVIPYRPSPPAKKPPLAPKARRQPSNENDGTKMNRRQTPPSSPPSPASEESKSSEDDGSSSSLSTPPPPPKQLFTPRSRSAVEEALVHGNKHDSGGTTPPRPQKQQPLKATSAAKPLAEKNKVQKGGVTDEKFTTSHGRSHSLPSKPATNAMTSAKSKSSDPKPESPPHVRARSTPPRSSSKRKGSEKMGFYQMAKLGYQELCNAIIRPPRSNYPLDALGPEEFVFCGEKFVRKDFGVVNERGLLLECSMWKRADEEGEEIGNLGGNHDTSCAEQNENEEKDGEKDDNECGQITLNVDDWDENKERGQMYLQVPESFEDASTTSDGWNEEYQNGIEDDADTAELIDRAADLLESSDEDDLERERSPPRLKLAHQNSETTYHSYYHGSVKTRKRRRDPVVIYLHGNSSGRTEVIPQLGHLLSLGVAVVAFDFAGSGKSEGEFVSLGYYEREDLQTVIHHLRASGDVSTIALWGRSMGAATAIMYGSRDPTISCMILDSSFTCLTKLAEEMVERGKEQGVNVPNFVVSVALRMIKSSVKSQAGFSIKKLSPISHVSRCFVPAMFVAGEHDDFINKRHSERLHDRYAGDKNIVVVDGDHNSPRPRFLLQSACLFLQSCMQLSPSSELVVPLGTNLLAPPWICPGILSRLGIGDAIARARAEAASLSGGRAWLPVSDSAQTQQQIQRQRSQPTPSKDADLPPGLPLEKGARSRSCTDSSAMVASPTAAEIMAASAGAPPDMSERQKQIQSSLFKMLGQQEEGNLQS